MERLSNVRRGIFHDNRLAFADVRLTEVFALCQNVANDISHECFLGNEHIYISVNLLNLLENLAAGLCNLLCDALCNERRSLAEGLS